jgi:hypothetical protein
MASDPNGASAMSKREVVVEGGNVYTVGDSSGTFYVRRGGFYGTDIGKTRSFDDALALIKSHSGKPIRSIG